MKICGIDIGLNGGLCFMTDIHHYSLYKMPVSIIGNKKDIDIKVLFNILNKEAPDAIIYEDIKSIFGVSKSTMLSLGKQIGYIKAYAEINDITTYKVPAKKWQEAVTRDIATIQISGKYKETFYKCISALYNILPEEEIKKNFMKVSRYDDGLVDAYLMAYYLFKKLNNGYSK